LLGWVEWRDRLSLTKLSAKTINTLLGTLSSAFSFFVGREWIPANPCRGVKNLAHKAPVFPWLKSYEQNYGRVAFRMPTRADNVVKLAS
jgi:hypothetical protein